MRLNFYELLKKYEDMIEALEALVDYPSVDDLL